MRKEFLSEFFGTFSMVFIGCLAIKMDYSKPIISFAFGFAIFLVIQLSQRFSIAHINPPRTFGPNVVLSAINQIPNYLICTIIGALFTAILAK